MKPKTLESRAHAFKARAWPKFRRGHLNCTKHDCGFCNGWTWGAVDGYRAGYMAARREWRKANSGE